MPLFVRILIVMNAPFGEYGEIFDDDGNVTLAHNGDYCTQWRLQINTSRRSKELKKKCLREKSRKH